MKHWLRVGYWNIKNVKFSDGSIKTEDKYVLDLIGKHDIMCLSEVQCGECDIPEIDGYTSFKLCRKINKKINRFFGGIVIYYKNDLRPGIQFLMNTSIDYVWLKFNKSFFNMAEDVFMCVMYIPPENSSYYKTRDVETFNAIEDDIVKYRDKGSLVLIGDMNARTNSMSDFIENDTVAHDNVGLNAFEFDDIYEPDIVAQRRTSQDIVPSCTRGRQLIELCKSSQLRIMNGRWLGDSMGNYTCHQPGGSSVVDYLITNESNMKNLVYFKVYEFRGNLSDHCCISTALKCNVNFSDLNVRYKFNHQICPVGFKWNRESIYRYQSAFTTGTIEQKVNKLTQIAGSGVTSIDELIKDLSEIYTSAAKIGLERKSNVKKNTKKDKKWFTANLASLRKEVIHLSHQLQKWPNVTEIRGRFFRTLKIYNKERKKKARQFKQKMLSQLGELRSADPKAYWKLLRALRDERENQSAGISLTEWKDYFKVLNCNAYCNKDREAFINDRCHKILEEKNFNELNFRINEKEISKAVKQLKANKATGIDLVSNEMIKYSQHVMLPILSKIFNNILLSECYPGKWCEGYIVPIFKSGCKNLPENYRGISIFSCLAKLFNTVLNNRLEDFLEKHEVIDKKQIGFKKKSRASDHMFILRCMIDKYTQKQSKLYACFIDFKKAFDKVNHSYLMYKLIRSGIRGNFFSLLQDMYVTKGIQSCVKSNNMLSDHFTCSVGVRQGDPLSPNLFKIFVNDISQYIDVSSKPLELNGMSVNYLLYADDIVLLAKDETELQKSVKGIESFCRDWGLTVNTDKSKVLVFNRPGKLVKTNILYNNTTLENVCNYKYLGLLFNSSGKFEIARKDLVDRGLKAMFKLTSTFKNVQPNYGTCIHLFDSIVKPILTYGSDICGIRNSKYSSTYNEMCKDIMEKCHLKYCRFVLGINRRAPNLSVYGDMGRYPIYISMLKSSMKYFYRLTSSDNELLHNAYAYNKHNCGDWWKTILKVLKICGIEVDNVSSMSCSKMIRLITDAYKITFRQGWFDELSNDKRNECYGNKLRTYRTFKNKFSTEPYLHNCLNIINRKNISRLRMSCHRLHIETGRYVAKINRLEPEDRKCIYCTTDQCEDEFHFLVGCPFYAEERNLMFNAITKVYPSFVNLELRHQFVYVMSSSDKKIISALGSYVSTCFLKRSSIGN